MAYANNYLEILQPHQNIEKKKRERERELKTMLWQS